MLLSCKLLQQNTEEAGQNSAMSALQQHGHKVLLLQQLQRQPTTLFLQGVPKVLDCGRNHAKRAGGSGEKKEQELGFALPPHHNL